MTLLPLVVAGQDLRELFSRFGALIRSLRECVLLLERVEIAGFALGVAVGGPALQFGQELGAGDDRVLFFGVEIALRQSFAARRRPSNQRS